MAIHDQETKEDEYIALMRKREMEEQARTLRQQQQQQQQQGQSISPMQAYNMYQQFSGGSAAAGGAEAGSVGSGGAASGSSSGSMMAAAGPWVALAAGIYLNEKQARDKGFRAEDNKQYAKDLASGKVLSQDIKERWGPKIFGKDDKTGMGADTVAGVDLANFRFRDAWKGFKQGSLGKLFKKIF